MQGYSPQKARQQYQNAQNNAQGHIFEDYIKAACLMYRDSGRAEIDKTPEAFRVLQKFADGIFKGRFTARAQPDFQGTLSGGRSIVFETKFTRTERMRQEALTDNQMKLLQYHHAMGAVAAVCCGIGDRFYFVPWPVWEAMKAFFGRLYVTAEDLEPYRVRFTGNIMFLDYIHPEARREKEALRAMKCPVCGHKIPETLAISPDCMERGGAGTIGVKQAQRLRNIAQILNIEASASANIREAMRGILKIAAEVEREG